MVPSIIHYRAHISQVRGDDDDGDDDDDDDDDDEVEKFV